MKSLRSIKEHATFFGGITLAQKTWNTLRGVLVEGAPGLWMLRLSDRAFSGPGPGRAPAHRTSRSQAVGSGLGRKPRIDTEIY
jgi:hypothetical protein